MKSRICQYAITMAASLVMLFSVNQAWAGTLSAPRGLTLDAKGNLYIVNQSSNSVLVYSPGYVKTTTITEGLNLPVGVALDSFGNIYVVNNGTNSVTQYSPAGVQNTNFSISNGINNPWGIAIDPLNDLWVSNLGSSNIVGYSLLDGGQLNTPLATLSLGVPALAVTVYGGYLEAGTTDYILFGNTAELLVGRGFAGYGGLIEATALTNDNAGNIYEANAAGTVSGPQGTVVTVNFAVEGIAVDKTRGRVYLSNQTGNEVLVYSMQGKLLHTIK
jgi:DNA-binding beta-propeller fold protein YncE